MNKQEIISLLETRLVAMRSRCGEGPEVALVLGIRIEEVEQLLAIINPKGQAYIYRRDQTDGFPRIFEDGEKLTRLSAVCAYEVTGANPDALFASDDGTEAWVDMVSVTKCS